MDTVVIRGRVVDREEVPVRGARVYVVRAPTSVPDVAQLTGSDGTFAFSVPQPGVYRIGISSAQHGAHEQNVDVQAKKASITIKLAGGAHE